MRLVLALVAALALALAVPPAEAAPRGCIPLTDNSDKLCYDTAPLTVCYYAWAGDPDPMCVGGLSPPPGQDGCIPLTDNSDKLCYGTRPLSVCYYRYAHDPDPMCLP